MTYLSNIFISDGFANVVDTASTTASQPGLTNFIPLILIFVVFYFLLIRPQQKKMRAHQNTLNQLKNGDEVQINGGIFGVVKSIDAQTNKVELEIASNVVVTVLKQNIADVVQDKAKNSDQKKVSVKNKKLKNK